MACKFSATTLAAALILAGAGIAAAQTSTDSSGSKPEQTQRMFQRIDADKDGKITLVEMEEWRTTAIFRLDADEDGKVTRAEVDGAMAKQAEKTGKTRDSSQFFGRFDLNGDGSIDHDELNQAGTERFQSADKNSDGAITLEEFQALHGS
jgi:Ca2+-binding EF-hand superfamily protein